MAGRDVLMLMKVQHLSMIVAMSACFDARKIVSVIFLRVMQCYYYSIIIRVIMRVLLIIGCDSWL